MTMGDIVQIVDEDHHWFPCLIVVDEVKSWGIQGYAMIPNNDPNTETSNAYIRLTEGQYQEVGRAAIIAAGESL